MEKIIRNRIKCLKCGTIIESKSRHDFIWCPCGSCAVDGGYLRERDVLIQTALDKLQVSYISGEDAIKHHARMIASKIQEVRGGR